jgi:sigma-B regulation protein RsbU (phosphoserine phosphatase)
MLLRATATAKVQSVGFSGAAREAVISTESIDDESQTSDVRLLTTGGPIIGAFNTSAYEQETIQMERGDLLVAYTDGVTEARDVYDQEFGEARLRRIIDTSAHATSQELSERIVQSVREWCGEIPPHDDLTLVVMKVR